jgi:hypothetical protein
MSYNTDIADASLVYERYNRYLREIPNSTVPREWVEALVNTLGIVLDEYADLAVVFEPEEFEVDSGLEIEPDDGFPFEGDGDHSETRGNG